MITELFEQPRVILNMPIMITKKTQSAKFGPFPTRVIITIKTHKKYVPDGYSSES